MRTVDQLRADLAAVQAEITDATEPDAVVDVHIRCHIFAADLIETALELWERSEHEHQRANKLSTRVVVAEDRAETLKNQWFTAQQERNDWPRRAQAMARAWRLYAEATRHRNLVDIAQHQDTLDRLAAEGEGA